MNRRILVPAAVLAAALAWPLAALAQVEPGRGNILSINKNAQTIELKDQKGRVRTWKYDRNASVKFTDGAAFFPNPSTNDLRPPMYVHYVAHNQVIDSFDVVELGYQPGNEQSGASASSTVKTPGVPRTVTGRVTAYDPNVRQVELDINGRRETFQLTDSSNQQFNPGDQVQLKTAWSSATELVTQAQVLNRGGNTGNTGGGNLNRRGGQSGQSGSSQGQVVSVSRDSVVMQVNGSQQTYALPNAQFAERLRVGDTVRFDWRMQNGQMYLNRVY